MALLDVEMPVMDGITAASRITTRHPAVRVVMLTAFTHASLLSEATVRGHVCEVLTRTSTASRTEVAQEAARAGLG